MTMLIMIIKVIMRKKMKKHVIELIKNRKVYVYLNE